MTNYAFLEFEDSYDADDCVREMNGMDLDGRRITVEKSHGKGGFNKRDEPAGSGRRGGAVRGNRENCVLVEGLGQRTTWKELKDFARTAGNVEYTDIWFEGSKKLGIIKYTSRADFKNAVSKLDDSKCDGERVRCTADGGDYSPSPSRSRSRSRGRGDKARDDRKRSVSRDRDTKDKRGSRSRSRSPGKA